MSQSKTAGELTPLVSDDDEGHDNFRIIKLNRKEEFGVYLPSQIDDQIRYDLSKRAIVITLIAFLICIVFLMAFLAVPILISPAVHSHHATPHTGNDTQVVEDSTAGQSTEHHASRSTVKNIVLSSTKDTVASHNDLTHTPTPSSLSSSQQYQTVKSIASLPTQSRSTTQRATTTSILARLISSTTTIPSRHAPSSTTNTPSSTTTFTPSPTTNTPSSTVLVTPSPSTRTPSSTTTFTASPTTIPSTHAQSSSTRFRDNPSSATTKSTASAVTNPTTPTVPRTRTTRWSSALRPRSTRGSSELETFTRSTSTVKQSYPVTASLTGYTGDQDEGSGNTDYIYKRETGSIS